MKVKDNGYNVLFFPENARDDSIFKDYVWDRLTKHEKPQVVFKEVSVPGTKKKIKKGKIGEITKINLYAHWDNKSKAYRVPYGFKDPIIFSLKSSGMDFNMISATPKTIKSRDVSFKVNLPFKPRDYQQDVLNWMASRKDKRGNQLSLQPGAGKQEPVDKFIPDPNGGLIRFGDIVAGDYVFGSNGEKTKVLDIHPQGVKPCYLIIFSDGSSVECGGEHLWETIELGENNPVSTLDMLDYGIMNYEGHFQWSIPVVSKPVNYKVSCTEVNLGQSDYYSILNSAHIPSELACGSIETRKTVLDKLSELSRNINSESIFTSVTKSLVESFLEVHRSMGGNGSIQVEELDGVVYYHVRELIIKSKNIISIERVEDKEQMCISVEAKNHLYLTNNFIVTHNTITTFFRMAEINKATFIMLRPFLMKQWLRELTDILNVDKCDVCMIQGSDSLRRVLDDTLKGNIKYKVYIVSNKTFYFYLKSYVKVTYVNKDLKVKKYEEFLKNEELRKLEFVKKDDPDLYKHLMAKLKRKEEAERYDYSVNYPSIGPYDLLEKLGIGFVAIDEGHLDPHLNYTFYSSMSNVDEMVVLSATYFSSDPTIEFILQNTFLPENVYDTLKLRRYIDYTLIKYNHKRKVKPFQYTVAGMYNHNKYEHSVLLKENEVKKEFLVNRDWVFMIRDLIDNNFIKRFKKSDKCLIFVSSVDLAVSLLRALTELYPDMNCIKYTGAEKDVKIILPSNIIVATLGKAAVGLDIRGLTTCISTISLASEALSVQKVGRLREFPVNNVKGKCDTGWMDDKGEVYEDAYLDEEKKIPMRRTIFLQLFADDLPPHAKHLDKRYQRLNERTKTMKVDGGVMYTI